VNTASTKLVVLIFFDKSDRTEVVVHRP
jgi:hypothetical protein